MSTHKATATRCLSYHQAASGQHAIQALATAPLRRLALSVLFTIATTSYQTTLYSIWEIFNKKQHANARYRVEFLHYDKNCYPMLVFCWHVFGQMYKLQIHKLVSRRDHLNISTIYSVFDWKEFEILSYRQAFLESTEISASEELNALEKAPAQFMMLRILSGKGEVQFMPFWKLSGKCHFLLRFCTSN